MIAGEFSADEKHMQVESNSRTLTHFKTKKLHVHTINRGSYMSVHVLLNLLNELGEKR